MLHLIGYAVQEQESGAYAFFTFHERAAKWDILPLMEELINSPRVRFTTLNQTIPLTFIFTDKSLQFSHRLKLTVT